MSVKEHAVLRRGSDDDLSETRINQTGELRMQSRRLKHDAVVMIFLVRYRRRRKNQPGRLGSCYHIHSSITYNCSVL